MGSTLTAQVSNTILVSSDIEEIMVSSQLKLDRYNMTRKREQLKGETDMEHLQHTAVDAATLNEIQDERP